MTLIMVSARILNISRIALVIVSAFFSLAHVAQAGFEEDYEKQGWQELEVQLPAAPQKDALRPFYVSAATDNLFFVDANSVSIGADGVIRYVLVVETSGGARNVSFEGMRCETRERRMYASGRNDGSWSKSRRNEWVPVREAVANRQYAALFYEYFCPSGIIADSREAVIRALRSGGHTDSRQR
jgi:hypothetical protein